MEEEAFNEQLKICAKSNGEDYEVQIKATALCSIAISLKRIADKLELSQKQPVIMTAEEYKNYTANQFIKNGI